MSVRAAPRAGARSASAGKWARRAPGLLLLPALLVGAVPSNANGQAVQRRQVFTWSGEIPASRWIRLRDLNGSIIVGASTSKNVEVTAVATWRRGSPDIVRFDVRHFGPQGGQESVLICALWKTSTCSERSYDSRGETTRDDDVAIEFTVRVPRGVNVGASTVNGEIRVASVSGDVDAETTNGELVLATAAGSIRGSNVNGNVTVKVDTVNAARGITASTVNGNVRADLPARLDAQVNLSTTTGSLTSDYPIAMSARYGPRRVQAPIGRGGPWINLSTVNGSLELRRR